MNPFRLYAVCASFYGSARASFRVPDSDMLPDTKLLTIVRTNSHAHINRASIFSNGLKYSDYGYPDKDTSVADVLFH
jgi:hypothetical protein